MLLNRMSTALLSLVLLFATAAQAEEDYSSVIKRFKDSPVTEPFFKDAYGYAVYPKVGKGGVGIGGAYGSGQVYHAGKMTGNSKMFKVSWGLQMGGQAFSQIVFFQDKRAFDEFTRGSFEFDATASAVAITAGAQAQAGTKGTTAGASAGPNTGKQLGASYVKGYAVFTHVLGGLMYEAAIAGQKFNYKPL
jgi:lipid-binding SYLF domain-containing protein